MLKKVLFSLTAIFLGCGFAMAQAKIQFDKTTHDFGDLKEGSVAQYKFKFKNVGAAPLVIDGAQASCGCTVPFFPREPILPGQSDEIEVKFDTQDRPGIFTKTINIMSNSEGQPTIQLMIKGNVIGK